ncbi:hypothetical protein JOS77_18315 [Chromobacterium haemolyticum]|nr:hypothetical protein JOS77_18315 [Chromobacterium haemolyticum]
MPAWAVTLATGPEASMDIAVKYRVVSNNTTAGQLTPAASVNGDQLCIMPRARTL